MNLISRRFFAASLLLALPLAARGDENVVAPAASTPTRSDSSMSAAATGVPRGLTPKEIEAGDKAVLEVEKQLKGKIKTLANVTDPADRALLEKLNRMVKELGSASARPLIPFSVKLIEDKDINSFTLPGGRIYIYRGLLDITGSDDEIAAVLAHEIGHNAKMHALRGDSKAKKLSWMGLAAMLAGAAGGANGANLAQFSQYLLTGIMNGYSEGYEREADAAAIDEMKKTSYNPSAMVTMMQRLKQEEMQHPEVQLGIFRDHPPSAEREAAALSQLQANGLPFTPRNVLGAHLANVIESSDRAAVKLDGIILIEFAPDNSLPNQPAAKARAAQVAQKVNNLLKQNLQMHEISVDDDGFGARILARNVELARVTPADAALQHLSPQACAEKWRDNFRRLFWRETINGKL